MSGWFKRYPYAKEIVLYLFFGGLTTAVNFIVFFFTRNILLWNLYVANSLAWIAAVIFAFITNKHYVFESKTTGKTAYFLEFFKFVFYRVLSFGMDIGSLALLVEVFKINEYLAKIIGQVLVVIANYLFSKLFIFNQQKNEGSALSEKENIDFSTFL